MNKGFILLNCDLGAEEYIVDELKQMQVVSHAYLTFGAYDVIACLLYTSPSPRDRTRSRMPSSA